MKPLPFVLFLSLLAAVPAHADSQSKHRVPKHPKHVESVQHDPVYFSRGDQRLIREYYAPRYRTLPPGLQKKYSRTGQLPPGWQRKLQPLPVVVERRLAPIPRYYRRGVIDGRAVVYDPRRQEIIDVTPLWR